MKKLLAVAALLAASTAAHAGESYSFEIGGRTIHIEAPKGCTSASCISVSIPGVYEKRGKRVTPQTDDDADLQANVAPAAPAPAPAPAPAAAPPAQASQPLDPANGPQPTTAPAPTAPAATTTASTATAAPAAAPSPAPAPVAAPATAAPAPAATAAPVPTAPTVASAPQAPAPQQAPAPAPAQVANTPLGIWLTEEKEGKVRIEQCGANLCGYSVNEKTNANGSKVLINMKPSGTKWVGRIHDPKGGSTYDSTIAMRGPNSLRVQGCAFGGMFCGGQTWTRVN